MNNQQLAKIFHNVVLYLEMDNVAFKPQAYEKAALVLETLNEDVKTILQQKGLKGLEDIDGIGKSIAEKIGEFIKTGKIKYYEELKRKMPVDIEALTSVEGLGPKMVKLLYQHLRVRNLADLERAISAGKIRHLPHCGIKTEQNILQALMFLKRSKGRFLLGEIYPIVEKIRQQLEKLPGVKQVSLAGSLRRMKETIGDADFLAVSSQPAKIMDFFVSLPGVVKVWDKGLSKSSVRMEAGFDMDIRVIPKKSYGAALQYFTGSKEHNIVLRKIAIEKGLKLKEYGLFKGAKMLASRTEEEIYRALEMALMPPEIRENQGEIEAAQKGGLAKLVNYNDIKGDLHCHSNWDGGAHSIEEMAQAAQKMGYQYLGISDHTKFLRIENGLNEKQLLEQRRKIDEINKKFKVQSSPKESKLPMEQAKFKVLQGCEANIMPDGSIDINDTTLAKLDYVIAGVHSQLKMPKEKMTRRIIKAMENPNVDIISHPTGRLIQRRDECQIDFDKILQMARETGTILEINSFPSRLDLKDSNIRKAKTAGVKMIINTDSHHRDHLSFIKYGIAQARRGWAEKSDIINTGTLDKLLKFFK